MVLTAMSSKWNNSNRQRSSHGYFGLFICFLVISQWVVGNTITFVNQMVSLHDIQNYWIAFSVKRFHKASGYIILLVSPYVVHLGWQQLMPVDEWIFNQMWFWYVPIVLFTFAAEIFHLTRRASLEPLKLTSVS
eukprot:UN27367